MKHKLDFTNFIGKGVLIVTILSFVVINSCQEDTDLLPTFSRDFSSNNMAYSHTQ